MKAITAFPTILSFALACHAIATSSVVPKHGQAFPKFFVPDLKRQAPAAKVQEDVQLVNVFPVAKPASLQTLAKERTTRTRDILIPSAGALLLVVSITAHRQVFNSMLTLLASYKHAMIRNPLQTKVGTGVILSVFGDAMAQTRDSDQYDARRALSFAAFDGCYRVFQHRAFPIIISLCQGLFLGGILSAVPGVGVIEPKMKLALAALERTLMYQLGVIPLLYYPIFFSFTGYIQGLTWKQVFQRAKSNFLPCWKRNLMFWIPMQLIMFGLIDEKWQIPFACILGMLWSTILSVTAGKAKNAK